MRHIRLWLFVLLTAVVVPQVTGQDLISRYKKAQFDAQARKVFDTHGMRARPRDPVRIPAVNPVVDTWLLQINPFLVPPPRTKPVDNHLYVTSWRSVRKLERLWFQRRFGKTRWAYSGNSKITPLDTSWTRELRGRLESRFGAPTQTLTEAKPRTEGRTQEFIQFEYWMIANDSIPVMIMDVNGPFDRGLVVATDQAYRDYLLDIRQELFKELGKARRMEPYIDYYYYNEDKKWYLTGYDGSRYILKTISAPDFSRGRPFLED